MTREPTNFGPYEVEEARRRPAARRMLRSLLRIGVTALAVILLAIFVFPARAHAGRSCEARRAGADTVARGMALAQRTAQALDASGARVVLLARAGQDLGKYGLRYSHLGIAYRQADGDWRVVHKLNQCGTAVAAIYRQGLGEFFLDDLWRHEAAWVVPSPEVQAQLWAAMQQPTARIVRLHAAPYSIVSYAWGQKYQQSNQWAIETLAASMEPATIRNREQAQAWLRFKGYEPTTLRLGPLTRLGGRLGSANIAFDDHPADKRYTDRIETVTVDSVFAWMQRAELGSSPAVLRLDAPAASSAPQAPRAAPTSS